MELNELGRNSPSASGTAEADRSAEGNIIYSEPDKYTQTGDISPNQGDQDDDFLFPGERIRPGRYWRHWSRYLETRHDGKKPYTSIAERHRHDRFHGHPDLARHMGEGGGSAIFRRFDALNCRILLYRQAEILELEHELDAVERHISQLPGGEVYQQDIGWLFGAEAQDSPGYAQYQIVNLLQTKLKEYNDLLLQRRQLFMLPQPTPGEVSDIWDFIRDSRQEGFSPENTHAYGSDTNPCWLNELESAVWHAPDRKNPIEKDLVYISPGKEDKFNNFLREHVLRFFYNRYETLRHWISVLTGSSTHRERRSQPMIVSGKAIDRFAKNVTIVIASVLPSIAVLALNYIPSTFWRLIFLTIWVTVFSSALGFFTSASGFEIFSASVAMAALQVVFIGTSSTQKVQIANP